MKKIGILYHPKVEATRVRAAEIESFLKSKGLSVWAGSAWDIAAARGKLDGTDLVLTVGGDGTILRAVQAVLPDAIPVTGINMGKLGFMTELENGEAMARLPEILDGAGWLDERAMLRATLDSVGREERTFDALNDIVLARGDIVRLVRVQATIDGQRLATFSADGVIVATATGSTGYSLAAGGPIMYPDCRDMLLVPVAPHLSLGSPLVVPQSAEIKLRLDYYHTATLSIDGHVNLPLSDGDAVTVRKSPHTARFLRLRPRGSFFGSLEDRLKGKQSVPGRKGADS